MFVEGCVGSDYWAIFCFLTGHLADAGVVRGLLPVGSTNIGGLGYAFKWVKLCSLEVASANAPLFPVVIDESKVSEAMQKDPHMV